MAQKDFDKARSDLDEAMTIAERGEMGLQSSETDAKRVSPSTGIESEGA